MTRHLVKRLLTLLLITAVASLTAGAPAWAHSELIRSDPADGATLPAGPDAVALTFSEPVQDSFTTVTVVGPGGSQWQAGEPVQNGPEITVPLRPLGPAGDYTIGYRVLSADSHPVVGAVRFTLTEPGPGAAAPAAPSSGGSGGAPVWPWIVGAVVLLGVGVGAALRLGRG